MSIYSERDILDAETGIDTLVKESELLSLTLLEPNGELIREMLDVVIDFVKRKKRKVYGGFALSALLEGKGTEIYSKYNVRTWDIDIYSPSPIEDCVEIVNELSDKGHPYARAREALHERTYKISARSVELADISYVPTGVYNRLPFKNVNGLTVVSPRFMMIDMLKIMSNPACFSFRVKKVFKRLSIVDRTYPAPDGGAVRYSKNAEVGRLAKDIARCLGKSAVVIGEHAYEAYHAYAVGKGNSLGKNLSLPAGDYPIDVVCVDLAATLDKVNKIINKHQFSKKVFLEWYHPFAGFMGESVEVTIDGVVACRLIPSFSGSVGFHMMQLRGEPVGVGSVATCLAHALVLALRYRVDRNDELSSKLMSFTTRLSRLRRKHMEFANWSIFKGGPFSECPGDYLGSTMSEFLKRAEKMADRKGSKKQPIWQYSAGAKAPAKYVFKNVSGRLKCKVCVNPDDQDASKTN